MLKAPSLVVLDENGKLLGASGPLFEGKDAAAPGTSKATGGTSTDWSRPCAGERPGPGHAGCVPGVEAAGAKVAGYYTLAAAGVLLADLPAELAKRLPRYPLVPVARLGRLAVDQAYRGRKLGSVLLWDAVQRSLRSEIAVFALVVDAKDDQAEAFYRHHGFAPFGSQPRQLVLPLTNLIPRAK
jgi:GNAT superfamily N-acetyltransferase